MQACTGELVQAAYVAHQGGLLRHLTVMTRDVESAQDLAHETFIRLAHEIDAGRAPDDTAAWLHRVGRNLATSRGRHLQVAQQHSAHLPRPADPRQPDDLVMTAEMTREVEKVLLSLSTSERHALVLAAYGFNGGEIAFSIGRTPAATRTLLCRARAKVRERVRLAQGVAA